MKTVSNTTHIGASINKYEKLNLIKYRNMWQIIQ